MRYCHHTPADRAESGAKTDRCRWCGPDATVAIRCRFCGGNADEGIHARTCTAGDPFAVVAGEFGLAGLRLR